MEHQKLIEQIERDEGLRLKPYRCTSDKLTIGYGRNIEDNGINKQEASTMLINDLARAEHWLDINGFLDAHHSFVRIAVLLNMVYQMGATRFSGFEKAIAHYHAQDYQECAKEMLDSKWAKQTPKRAHRLAGQMATGEWQ